MKQDRTVKLVIGCHPETPIPREARELGLLHRFALVLDSYRADVPYLYFDDDLFLRIMDKIDDHIAAEPIIRLRLFEPERDVVLHSLPELRDFHNTCPPDDREMPDLIEWTKKGVLVAIGTAERWDMVGGSELYNDSFTFSIYTRDSFADKFTDLAHKACEEASALVVGVYMAGGCGAVRPWFKKIF